MNTITHALVAATVLGKRNHSQDNAALLAGAFAPDAWIFLFYAWNKVVRGFSSEKIWKEVYWQEPWTSIGAIFNSIPLFAVIAAAGYFMPSRTVMVFGLAAFLHLALDFPFHNDDAHAHFWPFTMWRFQSPLSYWDPDHYGQIVSAVEALMACGLVYVLWQRFAQRWTKICLAACLMAYFAVPIYFAFSLGRA